MRQLAFSNLQISEVMILLRLNFTTQQSENVHYPSFFLILKIALVFAQASITAYALS